MLALQPVEAIFDLVFRQLQGAGNHDGIELDPLHAGRPEQPPVGVVQRLELALHRAADRRRQLAFDGHQVVGEHPAPVLLAYLLPPPQIPQQIGHEQRVAFAALVHEAGEVGRERVLRELQGDVLRDRAQVERARHDLPAHPAGVEVELDRQERVPPLRQVRRPAGGNHQQPRAVDPPGEIRQQIGGRWIGPVHVIERQHDRLHAAELFEQRRDFALQAFLRSG